MNSRSTINERFRRFQTIVRSVVRKYVFKQDDADEVTQDALMRLFKAHHRLPADPRLLSNYVFATAKYAAIDHLKFESHQRQYPLVLMRRGQSCWGTAVGQCCYQRRNPASARSDLVVAPLSGVR